MTIEKKLLGTNPSGGDKPNVVDVFSTYLYTGTGSVQTITNGIDLAGEGGLVWGKHRGFSVGHALFDTERVLDKRLSSNTTGAEVTRSGTISSFNSDGYSTGTGIDLNESGREIVSWTFRKAPKFFDVVTYTGNGVAGREIAHSLGCAVGMVHVKRTNTANNWVGWHKGITNTQYMSLNSSSQVYSDGGIFWGSTTPTDTVLTLGSDSAVNASGSTYVAYLFADNTAEDADDQMIKCGSFSHDYYGAEINLGWEPQYILVKATGQTKDWCIFDTMRGIVTGGLSGDGDAKLVPNDLAAENVNTWGIDVTSTGFKVYGNNILSTGNAIYMAIRAPMMKEPESATEVFAVDQADGTATATIPCFEAGFPVDMAFYATTTAGTKNISSRVLQGTYLSTSSAAAEASASVFGFDNPTGWFYSANNSTNYSWMWKRAKGFFDVVAYTGNGVAGRTLAHSLGVVPEMIWVKCRTTGYGWYVYHQSVVNTKYGRLEDSDPFGTNTAAWNSTTPTDTVFTVGVQAQVNANGDSFVAYLFASLDGISKVGSYTGNGSSQTINCGFSAGARFVLIRRTDSSGDWYIWDTTRGIVAGNDPHQSLNTTAAQVTSDDSVDPANSGFIVNQVSATNINVSSGTYIFYAIA